MSHNRKGFTLIELLIVIAIIAILVAILVPVFLNAKESARQGTVMSNYSQISTALERYHLEFHRYPQTLCGYAVVGQTMDNFKPAASPGAFPLGLFPAYIKTADVFQDPNNPADHAATVTIGGKDYYVADAFDVNPTVMASKTLATAPVLRYQTLWTGAATDADYARQLSNPNPPQDTYITCTTYHVPNRDQVLILFQNGSVKKMPGAEFAAQEGTAALPTFWKVKP